jgi:hypothetical protein
VTITADPVPDGPGAVWMADGSGTIELARLAGPADGPVDAPSHLLDPKRTRHVWDLSRDEAKIALYQLCLTRGSQYDIYRWVNLAELVRLWDRLELPGPVRLQWTSSLRSAGYLDEGFAING